MTWFAVVWAGFVAVVLALAVFWVFRSLGATQLSPPLHVGCIFIADPRHPATETVGFGLLLLFGSTVVPALYAQIFSWLEGPSWVAGLGLGIVHGLITAGFLPYLGTISACIRARAIPAPGRMGIEWGWLTPVALVVGHALYGAVCGAILANV